MSNQMSTIKSELEKVNVNTSEQTNDKKQPVATKPQKPSTINKPEAVILPLTQFEGGEIKAEGQYLDAVHAAFVKVENAEMSYLALGGLIYRLIQFVANGRVADVQEFITKYAMRFHSKLINTGGLKIPTVGTDRTKGQVSAQRAFALVLFADQPEMIAKRVVDGKERSDTLAENRVSRMLSRFTEVHKDPIERLAIEAKKERESKTTEELAKIGVTVLPEKVNSTELPRTAHGTVFSMYHACENDDDKRVLKRLWARLQWDGEKLTKYISEAPKKK